MTVAIHKSMSREEFFAWAESQKERYEFDGIQPVAMTGGNLRHSRLDEIAVTILFRDNGTDMFRAAGLGEGDILQLPEIGIQLPLADIYQGVAFEGQPDAR